jgi:preprotein translocase subunit SecY
MMFNDSRATSKKDRLDMSDESGSLWIKLAEKFFGLLLIVVSALLIYFTATSGTLGVYAGLFYFLSVVILIAGAFLVIVSPPE